MKKILAIATFAFAAAACSKEAPQGPTYMTLDFESATADQLAGPTAAGENLYSAYTGTQLISYEDPATGLHMGINAGGDPATIEFWNGGIAPSRWTDTTTPGYGNQCSVWTTGGAEGSKTFAIANVSSYSGQGTIVQFNRTAGYRFNHIWIANSTYAALSMRDGDGEAGPGKKFSTADKDWFRLTISAKDATLKATGEPVEFYLADFRTATSPGIATGWTKVDLSTLGERVFLLEFTLSSSDNGAWGMNTPAYFCFDNLTYTVPAE